MKTNSFKTSRSLAVAALLALQLGGCGRSNAPTDVASAKQALEAALRSWQDGQTPEALRQRSPSIVMVEDAWQKGVKLESFEIVSPDVDDGVNLHCAVKLTLNDGGTVRPDEPVTYIVGTSPVITICRDPAALPLHGANGAGR
ncbi:MAG TPA: hypothetical protein VF278_21005 [Pirellulales bacterium]